MGGGVWEGAGFSKALHTMVKDVTAEIEDLTKKGTGIMLSWGRGDGFREALHTVDKDVTSEIEELTK